MRKSTSAGNLFTEVRRNTIIHTFLVPKSGLDGTQGSYLMICFKKVLARTQIVIGDIACDVRSSIHEMMKKRDEARIKNKRKWKKSENKLSEKRQKGGENRRNSVIACLIHAALIFYSSKVSRFCSVGSEQVNYWYLLIWCMDEVS